MSKKMQRLHTYTKVKHNNFGKLPMFSICSKFFSNLITAGVNLECVNADFLCTTYLLKILKYWYLIMSKMLFLSLLVSDKANEVTWLIVNVQISIILGVLHLNQDRLMHMDFLHGAQFLTRLPEDLSADHLFKSIHTVSTKVGRVSFSQLVERFRLSVVAL